MIIEHFNHPYFFFSHSLTFKFHIKLSISHLQGGGPRAGDGDHEAGQLCEGLHATHQGQRGGGGGRAGGWVGGLLYSIALVSTK